MPQFPLFDVPYREINNKRPEILPDLSAFPNKEIGNEHEKGKGKGIKSIVFRIFYLKENSTDGNNQGKDVKGGIKDIQQYLIDKGIQPLHFQLVRSLHMEHLHENTVVALRIGINIESFITSVVRSHIITETYQYDEIDP
jgi:hypothetical protein